MFIIIDAYKTPRYMTKEMKINTINEFKNKYYLQCIQTFTK